MSAASSLLDIDDLVVEIQSMPALRGFSMRVARGAMVSLVGRNGAGKTTLMRSIMGHLKPARGTVRFEGIDLAASPRHARAAFGIGYMPEDRCLRTAADGGGKHPVAVVGRRAPRSQGAARLRL